MRLIVNFRKPFAPLEEALQDAGCTLARDVWRADEARRLGAEACLLDFCDAARCLRQAWRLARSFRPLGVALAGVDRDAPWHKGVRRPRLWLMARLRMLDLYASHSLQGAARYAERVLYLPNAARISAYNLGQRSLESLRIAASYEYDASFIGNLDAARYPEHRARVAFLHGLRAHAGGIEHGHQVLRGVRIEDDGVFARLYRARMLRPDGFTDGLPPDRFRVDVACLPARRLRLSRAILAGHDSLKIGGRAGVIGHDPV